MAWKRSWKVTAYICVLETSILYYISVFQCKKAYCYAICIVIIYTWVYRCVYWTSFRVWFRLCGLLVQEAGPNNWLQNLRKDVTWLVSFKVASSDVWTILKGRTWSRMVDYRKNRRESCTTHPKECCIGINTSSTILLSHSLLCIRL